MPAHRARIGVDVGGTNTDAVLMRDSHMVASVKVPTTADVTSGIVAALEALGAVQELRQSRGAERGEGAPASDALGGVPPPSRKAAAARRSSKSEVGGSPPFKVGAVMIGTTHFTNAIVERRDLSPVAAIRIGLPASRSLPPFCDWPDELARVVRGAVFMLEGGHEYDGRPIVPFDASGMRRVAREIRDRGFRTVGITSVFSPLTDACERAAADILHDVCPGVDITLSHALGRIGLLERENATLLNASLIDLARRTTRAFTAALASSGIRAPLFLTQNDGTIARAEAAETSPVFSIASGPTNSMRGAAFLSGLTDALVVDVGGTTTDIGRLVRGFPAEANAIVELGGVRTLFRMPDVISLGLGGGSIVDRAARTVGPRSVGYRLTTEALVFGGTRLTATDVAVAAGLAEIGNKGRVAALDPSLVQACCERIRRTLATAVDRMKPDARPIPLVAVGGGAFLVRDAIPGISEVLRVQHAAVANAVGAAIAQVSGEVDQIFSGVGRETALARATEQARQRALNAGADERTLTTVDVEDLPMAYLPGDARRVRVRVVGEAR